MRVTEMRYEDFVEPTFGAVEEVRRFGNCVVLVAVEGDAFRLLLKEPWKRVTVCEYESREELDEDVQYLRSLPPDDGQAGLPVVPLPVPPSRWARDARAMPVGDEELG